MITRRIAVGALAVGATAAALLTATSASAAVTKVNITAGGAASGTTLTLAGASVGAPTITTPSGVPLTCPFLNVTGSAKTGANQAPAGIAKITGSTWGNYPSNPCKVAGLPAQVVGTHPWTLNVTNVSNPVGPTTSNGQTTPGSITGVKVTVSNSSCKFDVTGTVGGSYKNANPSQLTINTSSLSVSNIVLSGGATNCFGGAITNGQVINFAAVFNVTSTAPSTANPVWVAAS